MSEEPWANRFSSLTAPDQRGEERKRTLPLNERTVPGERCCVVASLPFACSLEGLAKKALRNPTYVRRVHTLWVAKALGCTAALCWKRLDAIGNPGGKRMGTARTRRSCEVEGPQVSGSPVERAACQTAGPSAARLIHNKTQTLLPPELEIKLATLAPWGAGAFIALFRSFDWW